MLIDCLQVWMTIVFSLSQHGCGLVPTVQGLQS